MTTEVKLRDLSGGKDCKCLTCALRREVLSWHKVNAQELDHGEIVEALVDVIKLVCEVEYPAHEIRVYILAATEGRPDAQGLH
jgi:hypothetical protein